MPASGARRPQKMLRRMGHRPPRLRRALMWAVLLATTPVFFGEPYASAFPLERLLR